MDIELPKLSSAKEADVRIGTREVAIRAGTTYRLKVCKAPASLRNRPPANAEKLASPEPDLVALAPAR